MSNGLTSAIMGDPVRTPKPAPAKPDEPTAVVKWWKPGGSYTVTVDAKGNIAMNKALIVAMRDGDQPLYVRIGTIETGEIVIERTQHNNPMARKVAANGMIGGGSMAFELAQAGFNKGRYAARLNQQGTIALVKKS